MSTDIESTLTILFFFFLYLSFLNKVLIKVTATNFDTTVISKSIVVVSENKVVQKSFCPTMMPLDPKMKSS